MEAPASLKKLMEEKHAKDRPVTDYEKKVVDKPGYDGEKLSKARLNNLTNIMADALGNVDPSTRFALTTNGIQNLLDQLSKPAKDEADEKTIKRASDALIHINGDIKKKIDTAVDSSGLFKADPADLADMVAKKTQRDLATKRIYDDVLQFSRDGKLNEALFKEIDDLKKPKDKTKDSKKTVSHDGNSFDALLANMNTIPVGKDGSPSSPNLSASIVARETGGRG